LTTVLVPVEITDELLHDLLSRLDPGLAVSAEPQSDPWGAPQGAPVNYPPAATGPQTTYAGGVQPGPTPQGGYVPSTQGGYGQPTQSTAPVGPQNTQQQGPGCQHGAMRYVPAGVSQRTGKPYRAFWGCPADKNDPTKCKSIPA
jgi:hypothetical protein